MLFGTTTIKHDNYSVRQSSVNPNAGDVHPAFQSKICLVMRLERLQRDKIGSTEVSGTISPVRLTPFWTFLELILAHFWDRGDVPRTDLFQACFWEAKLCEIWWILVQNLGQVRMILCKRSRSAQHRFLNNSPTVFTDFRFREATAATISEPNIDVKSNVQTQVDFGYVFVSNWDSKMMPDRV